jgi:hypothetical protein
MLTDRGGGLPCPCSLLRTLLAHLTGKKNARRVPCLTGLRNRSGVPRGGRDGTAWVAGWVEWWVVMVSGGWWVVACGVIASKRACLGALRVIGPRVMRCG